MATPRCYHDQRWSPHSSNSSGRNVLGRTQNILLAGHKQNKRNKSVYLCLVWWSARSQIQQTQLHPGGNGVFRVYHYCFISLNPKLHAHCSRGPRLARAFTKLGVSVVPHAPPQSLRIKTCAWESTIIVRFCWFYIVIRFQFRIYLTNITPCGRATIVSWAKVADLAKKNSKSDNLVIGKMMCVLDDTETPRMALLFGKIRMSGLNTGTITIFYVSWAILGFQSMVQT